MRVSCWQPSVLHLQSISCLICMFCNRVWFLGYSVCALLNHRVPPVLISSTVCCSGQCSQLTVYAAWVPYAAGNSSKKACLVWEQTKQHKEKRALHEDRPRGHTCWVQRTRQPCLIRPAQLRSCAGGRQISPTAAGAASLWCPPWGRSTPAGQHSQLTSNTKEWGMFGSTPSS